MARRERHKPEQVVNLLRQVAVAAANGKTTSLAYKAAEIMEQTYHRWRKRYGGPEVENAKLKALVAKGSRQPTRFSLRRAIRPVKHRARRR